ncbi:MAG: PASTA domain-containing protein, partial [Lachnospiraceae bacterium]|nr:PASTA domain-containing protein [Lachnospiraceae bacterium]
AKKKIKKLDNSIKIKVVKKYNSNYKKGKVYQQSIVKNTTFNKGSLKKITLWVSKGSKPVKTDTSYSNGTSSSSSGNSSSSGSSGSSGNSSSSGSSGSSGNSSSSGSSGSSGNSSSSGNSGSSGGNKKKDSDYSNFTI